MARPKRLPTRLMMLVAIIALIGMSSASAQSKKPYLDDHWANGDYPGPYLDDDTRPNGVNFLPSPPAHMKDNPQGRFYNDAWYYEWGKTQRDSELPVWDEQAELYDVYSDVMGFELGKAAPEILYLAEAATTDAYLANKVVKNHYERIRPFAYYGEPSLTPDLDEELAKEWSYPSGHSTRGWLFAMVLASVAPDKADALAKRAYTYCINRVICGHHWMSDIEAGIMLANIVFAAVVSTEGYQEQLKKAREEYETLQPVTQAESVSMRSKTIGAYYDMLGRRLESLPDKGMYIFNGRKYLRE